ncbi:MFS transporter [Immundisolibacter sp.]|uniref:MFS transporter n=1 Tax=Immundisolibacter sp. TaxID=1934948 RepID=UPI002B11414A|nr:MFS transporter [Immundisolibacter sp.]MEA3220213.1 3-hydroxybenzoate transporter MhbT [Immundisolibacter sp.]
MKEPARTWDVAARLDDAPLGALHWLVLALTFAVAATDGLDAQIIGFTAPQIAAEFGIGNDRLGPVFSAALLGMTAGALLFGTLGDRFGRRRTMIACVALFGGGTLLTAFAGSVTQLMLLRLVTGLGLGGALPNAVTLVAECAPGKHRPLLVTLMYIGFSVGGLLGGVIAGSLVVEHGWRAMFYVGGGLPLVLSLLLLALLPESPQYLARRAGTGGRLSVLLTRLHPAGAYHAHDRYTLPEATSRADVGELFRHRRVRNTVLLWLAFFINLLVLFFLMNWLPKLLVDGGVPLAQAIRVTVMFNIGGVLGALVLAWLSARHNPRRMLAAFFALGAIAIMAIGLGDGRFAPVAAACFATGLFAGAAQVGLYPIATQVYPSAVRATGVGWAQAWGRIGSIFGPLAGGWLAVLEPRFAIYFLVFGAPLLVAAAAIAAMRDA